MIGKCNRLGFVKFASAESASRAAAWFAKMNEYLGTGILIEEYSPERNVKEVQVSVALPHDPQFSAQVVVRGIPLDWTIGRFQRYFGQYGDMQRATFGESRLGNRFRTGYVLFTLLASAERAVQDHKRRASEQPHGLQVQHKHR
ncbi:hypothetical protein RvY_17858 [Ramazzottius varieornatus]|uniref:RRM domain-containing protein n=1 Tax=Ramazzottius varieornatus TaxID=947166 RepID=A0A1D1W4A4_RAMVA|nr:hypothetical protein RvY_17858 [Ramazzottius varieornatus]